jgi:hypothetical protein
MIRTLCVAAVLVGGAAPALAATTLDVTVGTVTPVPTDNNFKGNLAGIGLVDWTDVRAAVSLSNASKLKFEFLAREAGFNNTFQTTAFSFTSPGPSFINWSADQLIGTQSYGAGSITDWQFKRPDGTAYNIGTQQFGIFLPTGFKAGDTFSSKVLYLGFDDTGAGPDDNHDDLIIRVSVVPEPSTWAMLIAGFGLVGLAARRRTGLVRHLA